MGTEAPGSLACPWCARFAGRPVLACRMPAKSLNARYACGTCGCRFTMDLAYMAAAAARAAMAKVAGHGAS